MRIPMAQLFENVVDGPVTGNTVDAIRGWLNHEDPATVRLFRVRSKLKRS